jgi:hypothetical protein
MPSADLDALLATLRTAADARMARRRHHRAQPAPAVTARAAPVAKAVPAPVAKAPPAAAVEKVPTPEELLCKARALRPTQTKEPTAATPEERRRQLRERHAEIMAKAVAACREGQLGVMDVAALHALHLRLDAALDD